MKITNNLILIGNGFDLAHGLKTSYRNFLDWYMCNAFKEFCEHGNWNDAFIEIKNKYAGQSSKFISTPKSIEEVLNHINCNNIQTINFKSNLFKKLIDLYTNNNWVDIERYYFRLLKSIFKNNSLSENEKHKIIHNLNNDFDHLIKNLITYIHLVNQTLNNIEKLDIDNREYNIHNAFSKVKKEVIFLNFNYTETLVAKQYAKENEVIHIHGRAEKSDINPIIFGYGDESDPAYQELEDSGENIYLEHIKSFGYFKTDNYNKLLRFIDSEPYSVYVIGHSCGLSDRILLKQIFEHNNCLKIDIFYHKRLDGNDNFKEITQEISRHFSPENKNEMRKKIIGKNIKNIIPQN